MFKLSIILAAYNVEQYIDEAIESYLKQEKSWSQLVIVNDGSTDSTKSKIEKYITLENNIVILNKNNGGLSSARNYGIEYVLDNSEYISFFDGDDILTNDYLSSFFSTISKTDADIIEFNLQRFNKLGLQSRVNVCCVSQEVKMTENLFSTIISNYKWHSCARFYKSDLFSNLRFSLGRRYEDMLLTPHLYLQSKKIFGLDKELYLYRTNENSITKTAKLKDIDDVNYGYHLLKEKIENPKLKRILYFRILKHYFSILLNISKRDSVKLAQEKISISLNLNVIFLRCVYFIYKVVFNLKQNFKG
ncbi:TPA: glycosyltransferase family 2 protein [Photobacterium damselae]